MNSFSIVEKLDVIKQIRIDFAEVTIRPSIDPFFFQLSEETLDTRIVVGTSASRHTASHVIGGKESLVARTGILTPAVAMEDRSFGIRIPSDGFSQGALHKLGVNRLTRRVTNHFSVVKIHDNRQIDPADLRLDVGDVTGPDDIGTIWAELLLHEVLLVRIRFLVMAKRSIFLLSDRVEAMFPHDPPDFPFADGDSFVSKLSGDLPTSIGIVACVKLGFNRTDKSLFPFSSSLPFRFLLPPLIVLPFPDS